MLSSTNSGLFSPKNDHNSTRVKISSGHTLEELLLKTHENEACVYWYFGSHGLKQGAIDFYRTALTQNINRGATPYLVDLTAWGAFNKSCPLTRYHESAVSLENDSLKVLKCSDFFSRLQEVQPEDPVYGLLKDIVNRENLLTPSAHFDKAGITLGDLFNQRCPALEDIYQLDCAKSYSVIQYIEFLFLVEMILLKQKKDLNTIKFILPNDEAKYYLSTISRDLQKFLEARGVKHDNLNVQVQCFQYGEQPSHRPYNCPSKTIPGKKKLTPSSVLEENALNLAVANRPFH